MGFLDKILGGNADMIDWQNAVMEDKSDKLYMSRKQLEAVTIQKVTDNIRIFDDNANIITTTVKPDVFFSRLELSEEKIDELVRIEPYIKYAKAITLYKPISDIAEEFKQYEEKCMTDFLYRAYQKTKEKADSMKTDKGKTNQYEKFQNSISPYVGKLSTENKKLFESMCNRS